MLGSSVDRQLPPSFLWKNCHKKYNCWDKKITFTIALTSFRKNSKNLFTYTLFSSGKNPRAVPRGRWKLHGIQEEKKRLDSRQEVWFVGEKNVPQWNQIWFSDSNLLLQNPAEVMGDNKSCKSAKDEHSTKGRHQNEKHTSIRALPECGGGVYPCPNFFDTFLTN